jgi:hypothetical protein
MFITIEELAAIASVVMFIIGIIAVAGFVLNDITTVCCCPAFDKCRCYNITASPTPSCGYDANSSSLWNRSLETPCPSPSWHPPRTSVQTNMAGERMMEVSQLVGNIALVLFGMVVLMWFFRESFM